MVLQELDNIFVVVRNIPVVNTLAVDILDVEYKDSWDCREEALRIRKIKIV